jgi:hypothetical protein
MSADRIASHRAGSDRSVTVNQTRAPRTPFEKFKRRRHRCVATLVLRWLGNDTELLFFLDGD